MSGVKKLFGDAALYGLSSILARLLNFLLTPLLTAALTKAEYGVNSLLYVSVAFAMVLLTNNYFAWLWEAKLHFKDKLKTDYNSPKEIKDMAEISQAFMQCEINLESVDIADDQEWNLILVTEQEDPIAHEFYEKATTESHTKVRQASRKNPKYKAFKKALDEKEKEEEEKQLKIDSLRKAGQIAKDVKKFIKPKIVIGAKGLDIVLAAEEKMRLLKWSGRKGPKRNLRGWGQF